MEKLRIIWDHLTSGDEALRKRVLTGALAVVSVVVLAGGAGLAWYLTPPKMPETPEEAAAVMKSARFQRLSADEKRPYFDVIRERWGMDRELRRVWREDEELRDAGREMFRQMMDERLDAFMLADAEERAAMMEQGMGFGRPPRGGGEGRGGDGQRGDGGGREGRGGRDPSAMRERMSDRLANGSAQRGAAMGEMIQSRRQQGDSGR